MILKLTSESIYDYCIVGHGIAGAILSDFLLSQDKKVVVINSDGMHSASRVAGGLYNPITGRKMVKTWNADKLFPIIEPYYRNLEYKLESKFLYDQGIYRPFISMEEQNLWQSRISNPKYAPYIEAVVTQGNHYSNLNDPFGGLKVKYAGFVDTRTLVAANKKYLTNKGIYYESVFKESHMVSEGTHFIYGDLKFWKLIYCSGYNVEVGSSFDWLPFRPVKGEIADIEIDEKYDKFPNRGIFIISKNTGVSRVGSTYNWREIDDQTTIQGKIELEEKMQVLYKGKYKMVGQQAGIRPATKDRRPFIGLHPQIEGMGIFSGFGSKGVSMIPYYAGHFVDHLENGSELDPEVDICRYF